MASFSRLLSLPKTLYVNCKLFPLSVALRLPVFVHYRTKLAHIERGSVKLGTVRRGIVQIGFHGTKGIPPVVDSACYLELRKGAQVFLEGSARFAIGTSIRVGGKLNIGDDFSCNVNCLISCNNEITFGKECLIGWNVNVRDSDNHTIVIDGKPRENDFAPVHIGDHVWIGSYADILKGGAVSSNSIVGYRACVTKPLDSEDGVCLAGCPAKVIRNNVNWIK